MNSSWKESVARSAILIGALDRYGALDLVPF
jgi:hypothetical protein